jgi:hypothetical protein
MKVVVTLCCLIVSEIAPGSKTCVKMSASGNISQSASTTFSPPRIPISQ